MATSLAGAAAAPAKHDDSGGWLLLLGGVGLLGGAGYLWWRRSHPPVSPGPAPSPSPSPVPVPSRGCRIRPQNATDSSRAQWGENWQLGVPVWALDIDGGIVHAAGNETAPYNSPVTLTGPAATLHSPNYFGHDVVVYPWQPFTFLGLYDVVCS